MTPALHDRPDLAEILDVVEGFLRDEVAATADPRMRYHALVAASLLRIAAREVASVGDAAVERWSADLRALGFATPSELSTALRGGVADPGDPKLRSALRRFVEAKVVVARPDHMKRRLRPHDPVMDAPA